MDNFDLKKFLVENKLGMYSQVSLHESIDIRDLVSKINAAKKAGQEIAVNGEPVNLWVASMGLLRTDGGRYKIDDIAYGDAQLTIDGEPVELSYIQEPEEEPIQNLDKPTPGNTSRWTDPTSDFYRGGD
jgi:hypothetical protein